MHNSSRLEFSFRTKFCALPMDCLCPISIKLNQINWITLHRLVKHGYCFCQRLYGPAELLWFAIFGYYYEGLGECQILKVLLELKNLGQRGVGAPWSYGIFILIDPIIECFFTLQQYNKYQLQGTQCVAIYKVKNNMEIINKALAGQNHDLEINLNNNCPKKIHS